MCTENDIEDFQLQCNFSELMMSSETGLHIGFLTPEYVGAQTPQGGLANYLRKVGRELTRRGHRVSVLSLSKRNAVWNDGEISIREIRKVDYPWRLNRIRSTNWFTSVLARLINAKRLESEFWKVHHRDPVNIVQAASFWAPGFTFVKNKSVPMVCRLSSFTPLYRSALGWRRDLTDVLLEYIEARQVIDAQASFSPSQFMCTAFERFEGYRPLVIRSPIEAGELVPRSSWASNEFEGSKYLLVFGRLNRYKGTDLLGDALPPILEKHQELRVVFIGPDDGILNGPKMFDYVRGKCQLFENRLHYRPPMTKQELYPILAGATGVLMPSRVDNYPNACLEALALGIPVIGTYESSLEEIIVDGKIGFLAKNGDPESLRLAINRLLTLNAADQEEMRTEIASVVQSMLEEDRIGQLVKFYETAIKSFEQKCNTK